MAALAAAAELAARARCRTAFTVVSGSISAIFFLVKDIE
jgi:hypothetical protein